MQKTIKRLALVASAAVAFAGITGVAAKAAVNAVTYGYTSTATTVGGTALTAGPSGTTYTKNTAIASDALSTFTVPSASVIRFSLLAGDGQTWSASSGAHIAINGVVVAAPACTISTTSCLLANWTAPSSAGTYTITITPSGASTSYAAADVTWSSTVTLTVTAASAYSAGASSAYANDLTTADGTSATDGTIYGVKTLNTEAGLITVTVKNANGSVCSSCTVGGYITGAGYLAITTATNGDYTDITGGTKVRSLTATAPNATNGVATIGVYGDGTQGTGTVYIRVTDASGVTTTLATKSVVFYGNVTKLVVTSQPYSILKAGGATSGIKTGLVSSTATTLATSPAFVVEAQDSNGNPVGGLTLTASSSDATVVSAATVNEDVVTTIDPNSTWGGPGYYVFDATSANTSVSGGKASVTVKILDPADTTNTTYITSPAINFTIGGSVSTQTVTLDSSSYTPGGAMTITVSAKDSSGNPVYDGAATPGTWVTSKALGGAALAASSYVGGTKSITTAFAPAIPGDFTITATGTDTAATKVTASATVTDPNADSIQGSTDQASLATDAANAATDAPNAAADAADAATQAASDALNAVQALDAKVSDLFASLDAKIASIMKLVAKLMKK